MPLTRTQKEKIVDEFTEKFKQQKVAVFIDFHGLSVKKAQELRRALKSDEAEYKVGKKTLFVRALEKAGISFPAKELRGELGVAFGYHDEVAPAKTIFGVTKEVKTVKMLGGILGVRALGEEDMLALAKLPAREILLAQLVGAIQSPLRGLVTVLSGNMRNLVTVLNKVQSLKTND